MESADGSGKALALKLLICIVLTGIAVFFAVQASLGARDSGVGSVDIHDSDTNGSIDEAAGLLPEGMAEELAGLQTFDLVPLWEQEVRGEAFITEDGGYLYITSTQGQVMAVDALSGATLWSLDLGVWVSAPPTAKEGVVYVGATNHVLYALDARSGALLWYYNSQGEILARPVVSDGMVFFTADNNSVYDLVHRLYALDARSGALLWIYDTESWTPSPPAVGTDAVYLGGYQREVYALQKNTGQEMWSFKASNIIFSSPRIISGKVLFTCIDGWVHALDAASGVQEWARKLPGFVWLAPPDGSGNLYACSHRDTLTAMALETGEELWTFTDGDFLSCSPIDQGAVVCAFNNQGGAYVMDASSGEPLGLLTSLYDFTSPPLLRGENFYAGSSDGFVRAYAIPADALPLSQVDRVNKTGVVLASPAKKAAPEKAWVDALTSELGYVGMICLTIFLYAIVALLALAPDGTIGKLSPIHEAVQRNTYLSRILEITGINRATNAQLVVISIILFVLLLAAYAWAILIFRHRQDKGLFSILSLALLLCIILTVIPPLVSKDVFSNIFYGKIAARYGDNPYIITPQRFANDQLMVYVSLNWKNTAIVYGPLHTYFSMFLNLIAGEGITANILVFKGAMAVFHLINTVIVWSMLDFLAPRRRRFGTMLYAWNPLALNIGVGGGHNDVMMMTLVLLALYLLVRGKKWPGFVVLCLSVMIKYITIILVVALVIYLLYRKRSAAERVRDLALYLAVFLSIAVVLFLPFWAGASTFSSTLRNMQLNNFSSVGGAISYVLASFFKYLLFIPASVAETLASVISKCMLLPIFFATLWLAPRRARRWDDLPDCFFYITLAYLVTTSYYMPWYFIWLLPLISLRPWDRISSYSLGVGTATIVLGCDVHPY